MILPSMVAAIKTLYLLPARLASTSRKRTMTPKQYLTKISIYRKALVHIEHHIESLYYEASGVKAVTYDKDKVQVSPENRLETMLAEIEAEKARWVKLKAKYERELRRRVDMIAKLDKPDHIEILMLRYVELRRDGSQLSFREISQRMHRSEERVFHIHGEALQAFRRRYKT